MDMLNCSGRILGTERQHLPSRQIGQIVLHDGGHNGLRRGLREGGA
jgi:hypothetical protein